MGYTPARKCQWLPRSVAFRTEKNKFRIPCPQLSSNQEKVSRQTAMESKGIVG